MEQITAWVIKIGALVLGIGILGLTLPKLLNPWLNRVLV